MNVGGSSILVIFIILCLTTFATLSMVSAGADLRLSEKATAAIEDYYAADTRAEQLLAEIDRALAAAVRSGGSAQSCKTAVEKAVEGAATLTVDGDDTLTAAYAVPMGESQQLSVELLLLLKAPPGERVQRRAWQVVPVAEWEPESGGFELWSGEGELLLGEAPVPPAQ